MRSKALTVALCAVLALFLAGCSAAGTTASGSGTQNDPQPVSGEEAVILYDEPASGPPYYYQADERWGGLPYATADSTVAESGCGLCCAAMAASYLTGEGITPPVLLNLVGNRCIDGGMNHMGRFCEELSALYGIEYQDLWSLDDAEEYLRAGWMIFAGMGGKVYPEGRAYGAHVLLIWHCDSEHVYIKDPDDVTFGGSVTWEQFEAIDWGSYFYAIREGQV